MQSPEAQFSPLWHICAPADIGAALHLIPSAFNSQEIFSVQRAASATPGTALCLLAHRNHLRFGAASDSKEQVTNPEHGSLTDTFLWQQFQVGEFYARFSGVDADDIRERAWSTAAAVRAWSSRFGDR